MPKTTIEFGKGKKVKLSFETDSPIEEQEKS